MKFTVLGAKGFIGSKLVENFQKNGIECFSPDIRNEDIFEKSLDNVIYSIGVSDFKERPFDAVEAHVSILKKLLEHGKFNSLLYISSGRMYYNGSSTKEEDNIIVNPSKLNDLYNISKAMGESMCIASKKNIKIVRPSNVTGNNIFSKLFIPSILRESIDNKKIVLRSTLDSEKDYVYIDDVVSLLPKILLEGKEKIYNIANGKNTPNKDIVEEISRLTNCEIDFKDPEKFSFPQISIKRIQNEFNFKPISVTSKIELMVKEYKKIRNN
jgi:nucleoside-diphosphate-sugar epimerase